MGRFGITMKKVSILLVFISLLFGQVDYSTQIQPIFNNKCTSCHINGGAYYGGLDLSSYDSLMAGSNNGAVVITGDHANSVLYNRITLPESDQQFMPKNGSPLSQSDIDLIAQWIDEGALETPATGFQPQTNQELETAVDLWIDDNTSALSTYGEINTWNVSLITDMSYLFQGATSFNGDISTWEVSNVLQMRYMFEEATNFNGDISSWDVSSVTNMQGIFEDAESFNGNISSWDVSNVFSFAYAFSRASSFNIDVSSWDISGAYTIKYMFQGATNFNHDLNNWNVSNVSNLYGMFWGASTFNGDISSWDVSNIDDLKWMFSGATNFNQDISSWDVSNVTDMGEMFYNATSFNQDISSWNVSNVNNMNYLFNENTTTLSDENKCAIHNSWSVQSTAWTYDWSTFCALNTDVFSLVPDNFVLHKNHPNPFNPVTTLRYDLPENALVNIAIYDMMGRQVSTLVSSQQNAGFKLVQWNATNDKGSPVSAGLYLYTIQAGDFRQTKKMVFLK